MLLEFGMFLLPLTVPSKLFFFFPSPMLPTPFSLQLKDFTWPLFLKADTTNSAWNNERIRSFTAERVTFQASTLLLKACITSHLAFSIIRSKQSPVGLCPYLTVSWIIMLLKSRIASFISCKNELVAKSFRTNSW